MAELTFGPFSVDLASRRIMRQGADLGLRPRAFHALKTLALHSGTYVNYEQMVAEAWEGVSVSRHTVDVTVSEVRKTLKEYGCWIAHRRKVGYCLEVPGTDDLLKRGRHFWTQSTREGFERALACFEQAALQNEGNFEAFQGVAYCHLMLATHGMRRPGDTYPRFLEAHERAVALAGLTPELRCNRAHALHVFERRGAEAESEFLDVLQDAPHLAQAYVCLAMLHTSRGRLDEAVEVLGRLQRVDPLFPPLPALDAFVHICRRENARALECGRTAIELHPHLPMGRIFYGQALEDADRLDEALAQYQLSRIYAPDYLWMRPLEAACLAKLSREPDARLMLEEIEDLRQSEYVDAYFMTVPYNALGERTRALQELERAVDERSSALFALAVDPKMDAFEGNRRFACLRNSICSTNHTH